LNIGVFEQIWIVLITQWDLSLVCSGSILKFLQVHQNSELAVKIVDSNFMF